MGVRRSYYCDCSISVKIAWTVTSFLGRAPETLRGTGSNAFEIQQGQEFRSVILISTALRADELDRSQM
jgi:hypothetical protein